MAQFLVYVDENKHLNYVALDDISCVLSNDDEVFKSFIYLKSDPNTAIYALYTPEVVMSGEIVNKGKLL